MTFQCVSVVNRWRSLVVERQPVATDPRSIPVAIILTYEFYGVVVQASTVTAPSYDWVLGNWVRSSAGIFVYWRYWKDHWPKHFWQPGREPIYFEQRDNVHAACCTCTASMLYRIDRTSVLYIGVLHRELWLCAYQWLEHWTPAPRFEPLT